MVQKKITEKLEQRVWIRPAYDKRDKNPKKNYGIHCVEMWMVLIGKRGAVHFGFTTGMYLPQQYKEKTAYMMGDRPNYMAIDVGYHSPKPMYDGQKVHHPTKLIVKGKLKPPSFTGKVDLKGALREMRKIKFKKIGSKPPKCQWLGVPCYVDGSALRAQKFLDVLVSEGGDKVWEMLRTEYAERFYNGKVGADFGVMVNLISRAISQNAKSKVKKN